MNKLFMRAGLALACCVSSLTFADYDLTLNDSNLALTVNGQACLGAENDPALVSVSVNGSVINIQTESGEFECGGVTVNPPVSSSSSSAVSSVPASSSSSSSSAGGGNPPVGNVDLSACGGAWPANVVEGSVMSLIGTGQANQTLNGNRTISFPVQALNAGHSATFSIAGLSNSLGVTRQVTLSACPGGPALTTGRCSRVGTESVSLKISQGSGPASSCVLENNKQYFINVTNMTCGSTNANCGFYRTIQ